MSSQLLATLKLVFVDGSTPVRARPAIQPLTLPQFAAGHVLAEAVNSDGTPKDLSQVTLFLGVRHHGTDAAPALMLQATNDPDVSNKARWELIPGHWTNVPPKIYGYDVLAELYGEPDDTMVTLPSSPLRVTDENVHPGDAVEVPASQQPLAQGPKGDPGVAGAAGPAGPAGPSGVQHVDVPGSYPYKVARSDGAIIRVDPSASSVVVNLPTLSDPQPPTIGQTIAVADDSGLASPAKSITTDAGVGNEIRRVGNQAQTALLTDPFGVQEFVCVTLTGGALNTSVVWQQKTPGTGAGIQGSASGSTPLVLPIYEMQPTGLVAKLLIAVAADRESDGAANGWLFTGTVRRFGGGVAVVGSFQPLGAPDDDANPWTVDVDVSGGGVVQVTFVGDTGAIRVIARVTPLERVS